MNAEKTMEDALQEIANMVMYAEDDPHYTIEDMKRIAAKALAQLEQAEDNRE